MISTAFFFKISLIAFVTQYDEILCHAAGFFF